MGSDIQEKNIKGKEEAKKQLYGLAIENFKIPGDGGWALGGFTKDPKDRTEAGTYMRLQLDNADLFRQYITQVRQETGLRLIDLVINDDGSQNKYWFSFTKRKFMNMSLQIMSIVMMKCIPNFSVYWCVLMKTM